MTRGGLWWWHIFLCKSVLRFRNQSPEIHLHSPSRDVNEIRTWKLEERTKHRANNKNIGQSRRKSSSGVCRFTSHSLLISFFNRSSRAARGDLFWLRLLLLRSARGSISNSRLSALSILRSQLLDKRCKSNGWLFTEKHNYFFCIVVRCFGWLFILYEIFISFSIHLARRLGFCLILMLLAVVWRRCLIELRTIKFFPVPSRVIEVHLDTEWKRKLSQQSKSEDLKVRQSSKNPRETR